MSTSIKREMERNETYGNNSCNTSYSLWIRRADLKSLFQIKEMKSIKCTQQRYN